jgi:hypothetical protein
VAVIRDASGAFVTDRLRVKDLTRAEVQAYDVGRLNPASASGKFFPAQLGVDGIITDDPVPACRPGPG